MPTEQTLSERFAVSRTVVREAISRMKSDGLVRSRQGSGLYVTDVSTRRSFKLADHLVEVDQVLALLEFRQPMEVESARLAATRATPDAIALIEDAHRAMIGSADWSEEGVAADLEFHHAIARATGNAHYADFMAFLGGALRAVIWTARLRSGRDEIKRITMEEHGSNLDAIKAADPGSAASAMTAHLEGARLRTSSEPLEENTPSYIALRTRLERGTSAAIGLAGPDAFREPMPLDRLGVGAR